MKRDLEEPGDDPRLAWKGLWEIELKLRGIAYLVFNQTNDPAPPLDLEEIQQGIGILLEEIAGEIHEVWKTLDESDASDSEARATRRLTGAPPEKRVRSPRS